MSELAEINRFEQKNKVMELYITGTTNPSDIAKKLGMKRADVVLYIDEWKADARSNPHIMAMAKETVMASTQHYDKILKELWAAADEAENNGDYKAKTNTLKYIADVDAKRIEFLQKAGLYDADDIGTQLAEMEERAEEIKNLLRRVAHEYPQARPMIMNGLSEIFEEPVAVQINE